MAEAQTLTIDLGNKTFDGLQPVDFGTTKLTKVDVLPEWVKDPTGKKLLTLRPIINRTLDVNTQLAFGTQPFRQADTNLIIDVPFMLQKLGNNAPDVEGLFPDMSAPPGPKSVFFAERFTGNNLIVQADKVGIEQTPAGYIFSIIHSDGTITYLVNPDEQKQSAPIAVSNVVNAIFKISDSVPSVATSTERKPAAPTPDQINLFIANGKAPSSLVIEKINQGVRLVAIGETHKELPEELEASKILKILQDVSSQGLINFLALEIDDTLQKDVDAYQQSGVLSDAMRNILLDHNAGYVELLKAAHTNKIQVLCVDNHNVENRDEYMNQKLLGFLQENPAYRGIFYVGDLHVTKYLNSLSDGLGGEYYAIWQTDGGDTVYNSAIAAGFTQPVAIEVNGSPFATVLWSTNLAWSSYGNLTDAIIVDPSK